MDDRTCYWFDKRPICDHLAVLSVCPGCQVSFEAHRANQTFCTRLCQNKTYMRLARAGRPPARRRVGRPSRVDLARVAVADSTLIGL